MTPSPRFDEAIETVEALPPDDRVLLIEIVRRRLIQERRAEFAAQVAEVRAAYRQGDVHRGTVAEFIGELGE